MPGLALGVEAPPAHPAAQVGGVDRVEAALGVDVLDPGADVEPVVVLLGALVRVQRLAVAELPLALAALALGRSGWPVWSVGGMARASGSRPRADGPDRVAGRRPAPRWDEMRRGSSGPRRQSALLTRCRSTWRRATRRSSRVQDGVDAPGAAPVERRRGHRSRVPPGRHRHPPRTAIAGSRDHRPRLRLGGVPRRPFGIYVHVPFCAARCGYCDFNTYTPSELAGSGASPDGWLDAVRRELDLAAAVVGRAAGRHGVRRRRHAVAARRRSGSATVLDAVRSTFGLAPGAEVTTESNPESTSPEFFAGLRRGRVHPGVAGHAVGGAARAAGAGPPAHARAARSPRRGRRARPGSRTSTST